jgi:hypothetical protein
MAGSASEFPTALRRFLPRGTTETWVKVAPLLPPSSYLAGGTGLTVHLLHRVSRDLDIMLEQSEDLDALLMRLKNAGQVVVSAQSAGSMSCVFNDTKVQVLEASSQQMIAETSTVGGLRVASVEDIMAMKLKVIVDRGALRDYFDIMCIEQQTHLRAEEGMSLFLQRFSPSQPDGYVASIVRSLGFFEDVADDPDLPVGRSVVEQYWAARQPEILRHVAG